MDGACLLADLKSFPYQRRPEDDCSAGRGGVALDTVEQGAERFMAKWIAAEKVRQDWTTKVPTRG